LLNKRFPLLILAVLFPIAAAVAGQPEFSAERVPLAGGPMHDDSGSFSFAILGDKTSGGEGKWPIYDRAVDSINLLSPDFTITTGDQIPGHMEDRATWDAEWAEYFDHARRLDPPLIMIPGNHDIANTNCYGFWKEDFGETYFSFTYGGCLFLVLNTEEERFDGRGPVWEKMMQFAEQQLDRRKDARHTFLFFHKPMWADPRFLGDWARLEQMLGGRPYTAVAGHEHYLSTERRNGNLLVVQNATGGGIGLSEEKKIGCFHGFAHVKVTGDDVTYTIVEPDGRLWPADVAPASFRRALNNEVLTLDADMPEKDPIHPQLYMEVKARLVMKNPFDTDITVRTEPAGLKESGWLCDFPYPGDQPLKPGESQVIPLRFRVPVDAVPTPPAIRHSVLYNGRWLEPESMRMERVDAAPLYPAKCWKDVPRWQVAGPFQLGPIDTSKLPGDPRAANENFFKRFGPEEGFVAGRAYEGGVEWRPAESCGNGLLNHNAILGTTDLAAAYNAFAAFSPSERLTHAVVYADNFAQVYVNGELVKEAQAFGAPGGFVYVPVSLEKGWNRVVVKVINNRGDWFLRFLLADPHGDLQLSDRSG